MRDDKGYALGEDWPERERSDDDMSQDDRSSDEDYSDDGGDEGEEGYRPGGYHPVNIGERYNGRYTVLEKLGWGHFSTVWMVHDKKHTSKGTDVSCASDAPEFVALKIQKSAPNYRDAAVDEIELLKCASDAAKSDKVVQEFGYNYDPRVVLLLDHFEHTGPNGKHFCFIFETLGENLLEVIKKYAYKGIPVHIVKNFVKQICIGLDFIHRHCDIIHTDLKPENILIATPPPLPSTETVKNVLAFHNPSTGVNKKKKKKAVGGGNSGEQGDAARAVAELEKQLQDPSLSKEAKKKLLKKLKNKKKKMKKKGSKKSKKRPSRRNGERGEGAVASSERRAMEADSNNIGGLSDSLAKVDLHADEKDSGSASDHVTEKDTGSKDLADAKKVGAEAKGDWAEEKVGARSGGTGDVQHKDGDSKMVAEAKDNPGTEGDKSLLTSDQLMMLLPPWLRPTLFSVLNFSGMEDDDSDEEDGGGYCRKPSLVYDEVASIPHTAYTAPEEETYSRLVMLVPARKLVEAFGLPVSNGASEDGVDGDSMNFGEWYLTLQDESRRANVDKEDTDFDSSLHFRVMGHGKQRHGLTGLTALCILNSLAYQPERYKLRAPDPEDEPIEWHITHNARKTDRIVAFLEERIPGLRFLCHYHVPSALSEEDDIELLEHMRQGVIHPLCEEMDEVEPNAGFGEGGGAMIGIDVDELSRSVSNVDEDPDLPESERRVYSITKYVHPLQRRLDFFRGDPEELDSVVALLAKIHATLVALGEQSDDGSEGGPEGAVDTARLDAAYADCKVKIVDLGNACWTYKHFTDDIQTRQYRSPEVILGAEYDCSADMWSLGCIVFELLTGDLLFDPRAGSRWDREEDHLAMMMELQGDFPASMYRAGKRAAQYFTSDGDLINIHELKFWPLEEVLRDKYHFTEKEAREIAAFVVPCLRIDPAERATAKDCLRSEWLLSR